MRSLGAAVARRFAPRAEMSKYTRSCGKWTMRPDRVDLRRGSKTLDSCEARASLDRDVACSSLFGPSANSCAIKTLE
jgi:hypothetical protein